MTELQSAQINARVFRRNKRNTIIIWDVNKLPFTDHTISGVFLNPDQKQLLYEIFVPTTPKKFLTKVGGVVIPHFQNKINENEQISVRIIFQAGYYLDKDVYPVSEDFTTPPLDKIVYLYVFDYNLKKWVPFPFDKAVLK